MRSMVLLGGGSLGRGGVDRLAQFPDRTGMLWRWRCREVVAARPLAVVPWWHGATESHRGGGTTGVDSSPKLR
jgi:hypothetical protein